MSNALEHTPNMHESLIQYHIKKNKSNRGYLSFFACETPACNSDSKILHLRWVPSIDTPIQRRYNTFNNKGLFGKSILLEIYLFQVDFFFGKKGVLSLSIQFRKARFSPPTAFAL